MITCFQTYRRYVNVAARKIEQQIKVDVVIVSSLVAFLIENRGIHTPCCF
jgi:hypothetical protein